MKETIDTTTTTKQRIPMRFTLAQSQGSHDTVIAIIAAVQILESVFNSFKANLFFATASCHKKA